MGKSALMLSRRNSTKVNAGQGSCSAPLPTATSASLLVTNATASHSTDDDPLKRLLATGMSIGRMAVGANKGSRQKPHAQTTSVGRPLDQAMDTIAGACGMLAFVGLASFTKLVL